jgi:hypothetical protein
MIRELLARFGLHKPPVPGAEQVDSAGVIGAIFNQDAARLAAEYERRQRGGVPLVGAGRLYTVPDHLK